jgi:hypothetical protein
MIGTNRNGSTQLGILWFILVPMTLGDAYVKAVGYKKMLNLFEFGGKSLHLFAEP